jgi:hypothetical protein
MLPAIFIPMGSGIMQRGKHRSGISIAMIGALASLPLLAGCAKPGQVSVSPEAAAGKAISLYDANNDGAIDAEEGASCPPLASSIRSYDADGDGRLTSEEIANRLKQLFDSSSNLAEVSLTVTLEGRPLSGATVRLRPVDFLAGAIPPAEGETDDAGVASPTIGDERLPEDFRGLPLVQHGLYYVEITHPERQLPGRYNTATELALVVDPSSREGSSARFDLKP